MLPNMLPFLLAATTASSKDTNVTNNLKDNWMRFVQTVLTPNVSCYKTVDDYGTMTLNSATSFYAPCALVVKHKQREVCITLNSSIASCQALIVSTETAPIITILLKDATTFCDEPLSALHMLLHSTSSFLGHGTTLRGGPGVPRHMFLDPVLRRWMGTGRPPHPDLFADSLSSLRVRDWRYRAAGGWLLFDRVFEQPGRFGHRLLAAAADPRYQADLLLQWMGARDLTDLTLTPADAVLLGETSCAAQSSCSGRCDDGYWDADCGCVPGTQPPLPCLQSSAESPGCDPASGSRRTCPHGAVVGADLDTRAHPGCPHLTAAVNGLASAHADVRRFLEAKQYPWQHFLLTILACPGAGGRLSDVTVGFPAEYRRQLSTAGLKVDREVLCKALRVYITNAEAQVRGGDSRLTHETLCLDDLVLASVAHLARPRRPPAAGAIARDAVHVWLGPAPDGVSVDLGQLVVKLYAVPAGEKVATPYRAQHELTAETLPAGKCVVEVDGKNVSRTTPAYNASTTSQSILNFSGEAMRAQDLVATGTGSIFGIAVLLLLLAYCMCQRTAGGGDWESDSSWSDSPASWTTSSTSSWTSTPASSADQYSTESFDFERDAHLVGSKGTLEYMRRVQEEALRRRRTGVQISRLGEPDTD